MTAASPRRCGGDKTSPSDTHSSSECLFSSPRVYRKKTACQPGPHEPPQSHRNYCGSGGEDRGGRGGPRSCDGSNSSHLSPSDLNRVGTGWDPPTRPGGRLDRRLWASRKAESRERTCRREVGRSPTAPFSGTRAKAGGGCHGDGEASQGRPLAILSPADPVLGSQRGPRSRHPRPTGLRAPLLHGSPSGRFHLNRGLGGLDRCVGR